MVDFTPGVKYGQRETQGKFVGIGHNSTFTIDPRLPDLKVAEDNRYGMRGPKEATDDGSKRPTALAHPASEAWTWRGHGTRCCHSKQYTGKMAFRTLATTPKGEVVIANDRGELRLYDKIDKKAKTVFPGWGGTRERGGGALGEVCAQR